MPPRAHWKGHLKLSLVFCPVALYPAVSPAERVSFRQVNGRTGNRLRHQLVDAVTSETVEAHDKARGYEVADNQFLLIENQDLAAAHERAERIPSPPIQAAPQERSRPAALPMEDKEEDEDDEDRVTGAPAPAPRPRIENPHTIEIERFVPLDQLDARYSEKPYYVAPRDAVGQEAFAAIRDAMRAKDMVGPAWVILSSRERPIAIAPMGTGLRGTTLRFAHEVRREAEYFDGIPDIDLPDEMLRIVAHIMETKAADFDPALLEDRYRTALVEVLKEKTAALPQASAPTVTPSRQNVVDQMKTLKRSFAAERPSLPSRRAAAATSTGRSSSRKPSNARARRTG